MKQLILLFSAAFIFSLFASSQNNTGTQASTNMRSAKYPQVLPDSRVIFRIKAPDAQRVQVDLVKKYDLAKDTGGYWMVTTDSISEGFHFASTIT